MVVGFVSRWQQRNPSTSGRFGRAGSRQEPTTGALKWLSNETGIPIGTIANLTSKRKDGSGRLGRNPMTELRTADALVAALGHPESFHDGTLPIMVNPNANEARRAECRRCGGLG